MPRRDLIYILWAADRACLAFTNCFMYLFLALHLETISSLSILESQQPISDFQKTKQQPKRFLRFLTLVKLLKLSSMAGLKKPPFFSFTSFGSQNL